MNAKLRIKPAGDNPTGKAGREQDLQAKVNELTETITDLQCIVKLLCEKLEIELDETEEND